ncbi:hypothetical protein BpHYR1_050569 [Brachionus plicatilis]|uniref:Uncharacterized protein n=1 Tax=Brachionus plicatilis TaxID=10195 RepID=A0A3M7PAT1_BRAPC|nr:hypothetical protein BpHYR1_050569 [Brachionus plicatilis]
MLINYKNLVIIKIFRLKFFILTTCGFLLATCLHLLQFQRLYSDIDLFNLQGLEKLNDQTTNDFSLRTKGRKQWSNLFFDDCGWFHLNV